MVTILKNSLKMAKPIKSNNKDVIQSYIFTRAKYDYSVFEKRILYNLVDMAQADLKGLKMKDNMCKLQPSIIGDIEVTMPVRDIFRNSEDVNYTAAKRAFYSLSKKDITFENDKVWMSISIIWKPKIEKGTGIATFTVAHEIWQCIEDFSKGYRKYELETAKDLKSVYAMRFYEFVSGQTRPITFVNEKFQELCDILKLPKSYRKTQAFENRVLNIAKAELDANCPYSFKYERVTVPSRGRNKEKVIGYTFYPYFIQKNRDPELEQKDNAARLPAGGRFGGFLDDRVYKYLVYNMGWSKESANRNKLTIMNAQLTLGVEGLISLLAQKKEDMANSEVPINNPVGYIVNTLKTKIQEGKKG